MSFWRILLFLLAGAATGAGLTYWYFASSGAAVSADRRVSRVVTNDELAQLSRSGLAEHLLSRKAATFVQDERSLSHPQPWVAFYDAPEPYPPFMCKISRYVFLGRDNLRRGAFEIETTWAIIRPPGAKANLHLDRECAAYRDFRQSVFGDALAIERAAIALDAAVTAVRAGNATFSIQCVDGLKRANLNDPEVACDGAQILRNLDLRDLHQVREFQNQLVGYAPAERIRQLIWARDREPAEITDHPTAWHYELDADFTGTSVARIHSLKIEREVM